MIIKLVPILALASMHFVGNIGEDLGATGAAHTTNELVNFLRHPTSKRPLDDELVETGLLNASTASRELVGIMCKSIVKQPAWFGMARTLTCFNVAQVMARW
jgi:sirohydrochlorin ferrochelatase